jgi:hypothetical protein
MADTTTDAPNPTPDKDKPADKSPDKAPDKPKVDATGKKPELTEEERVEARVQERLKAERLKDEQKAQKDKARAEEEEAKKRGEFEKLHAAEKAAREAAEQERDRERLSKRVIRALTAEAGKHAGYDAAKLEAYLHDRIVAGLKVDADDKAVGSVVAEAVKQFVADFPLSVKGGGAPPAQQNRLPVPAKTNDKDGNGKPKLSRITAGF